MKSLLFLCSPLLVGDANCLVHVQLAVTSDLCLWSQQHLFGSLQKQTNKTPVWIIICAQESIKHANVANLAACVRWPMGRGVTYAEVAAVPPTERELGEWRLALKIQNTSKMERNCCMIDSTIKFTEGPRFYKLSKTEEKRNEVLLKCCGTLISPVFSSLPKKANVDYLASMEHGIGEKSK